MGRLLVFVALITTLIISCAAARVEAAPPTSCIAAPFPIAAPQSQPTYHMVPHNLLDMVVWRQSCQDSSGQTAVLVRITPLSAAVFFCSDFTIIQNGQQIAAGARSTPTGGDFCGDLFVPTTFLITTSSSGPVFNGAEAFTLIYQSPAIGRLEIPAAGPQPPPPPTILVVATGCTTCHSGQVVGYEARITNQGPPFLAEIKGGARAPDGTILPLLHQVTTVPSGQSVIVIAPAQVLPQGLPSVDLLVEAAILEPALGVTLARHNVTLHLLP